MLISSQIMMIIPAGFASLFQQEVNGFTLISRNPEFFFFELQTRKMLEAFCKEFGEKV